MYGGSFNNGTLSAITTNIGNNSIFGGDETAALYFGKGSNGENFNASLIEENFEKAASGVKDAGNKETQNFVEGLYQSTEEKQEIYMENLTNEISAIYESVGHWGDVINTAIEGIGGLLKLYVGQKLVGGLLGNSGVLSKGGSLLTALGSNGAIATATKQLRLMVQGSRFMIQAIEQKSK